MKEPDRLPPPSLGKHVAVSLLAGAGFGVIAVSRELFASEALAKLGAYFGIAMATALGLGVGLGLYASARKRFRTQTEEAEVDR